MEFSPIIFAFLSTDKKKGNTKVAFFQCLKTTVYPLFRPIKAIILFLWVTYLIGNYLLAIFFLFSASGVRKTTVQKSTRLNAEDGEFVNLSHLSDTGWKAVPLLPLVLGFSSELNGLSLLSGPN